jgi:hypothetical protein
VSTIAEIENAIDGLPREEFFKLMERLRTKQNELWDRQMEKDAQPGGALDRLAEEALAEYRAGKTRPLP